MIQKLTAVDAAFFQIESHDTPMHVAALQIFSMPANAGPDFMRKLVAHLRSPRKLAEPWNLKLKSSAVSTLAPDWVADHDVDLDYHVRHLALPQPGGERELGVLVSRLHSHRLNRRRPLWECHVIEGLGPAIDPRSGEPHPGGNRFALFTKIHHALVDGVTTMRLLTEALSQDADSLLPAPWAYKGSKQDATRSELPAMPRRSLIKNLRENTTAAREIAAAVSRVAKASRADGDDRLCVPFTAPKSALNTRVTGQRRLATQQFELARLKVVTRTASVTLNDLVLALSSAALRRFLQDANALPAKPLVAAVPVSLRAPGDANSGNAVSMMFARMGTDLADPRERLEMIHRSSLQAKQHLQQLTCKAQAGYTSLVLAPFVGQILSGMAGRTRPYFNVTVSNVPGPSQVHYFNGAKLEAMYPVSIATHGQAVNITCTSYAGTLNFGFVGCPDALPGMQRMALYTADALHELEVALGIIPAVAAERPRVAALPARAA
ncbi:MAG: wax ester/triacylglycerol synthase family O-acyltransferase [Pseudomonadota bacterium]|nr:wax ester/triacylglycerol synthase family O-acyltransferase [Pseudomonadota bacterium]